VAASPLELQQRLDFEGDITFAGLCVQLLGAAASSAPSHNPSSSTPALCPSCSYNELLRACPTVRDKVIYLPYEVSSISGLIGRLPETYGNRQAHAAAFAARAAASGSGAAGGDRSAFAPSAAAAADLPTVTASLTAVTRVPTGKQQQFSELD